MKYGISSLSMPELLSLLIRVGTYEKNSLQVASELLQKADGVQGLAQLSLEELMSVKGIKMAKALELQAVFEIGKRLSYTKALQKDVLNNPKEVIRWIQKEIGGSSQEKVLVAFLDSKNHLLGHKILFVGSVDQSIVHPREVFKEACRYSSSKVLLAHNHPSYDVYPSSQDMLMTSSLCDAGNMMQIPVIDHVIVSPEGYFSFKEEGLL